MTDRLTAIKARLGYVNHVTRRQSATERRKLVDEDLPWAVSRLEQLQEDVQRVVELFYEVAGARGLKGAEYNMLKLLQAALDRSKS